MKFYHEYFDTENTDMEAYLESEKEALLPKNQISRLAYGFALVRKAIAEKIAQYPDSDSIVITGFDSLVMATNELFNIVWDYEKDRVYELSGVRFSINSYTLPKTDEFVFTYTNLGESNEI